MALPETDLHRIRLWARERVPEHLWDELKVEADVTDRHVDIVEVRPLWDGVGEHTRFAGRNDLFAASQTSELPCCSTPGAGLRRTSWA